MIELQTNLPGKKVIYGDACKVLEEYGLSMGGNWDFDRGMFDGILYDDGNDKIYLRLPFSVLDGMLDDEATLIKFEKPFIVRHILNIGLDNEESQLLTAVGLEQFQSPDAPDAPIYREEWVIKGEEVVSHVENHPLFTAS